MKKKIGKDWEYIENDEEELDKRMITKNPKKVFDNKGTAYMVNLVKVKIMYGNYSKNLFYKM